MAPVIPPARAAYPRAMRRPTEGDLTIVDARGTEYPPRHVVRKTLDTVLRTLVVLGLLYLIGFAWESFA